LSEERIKGNPIEKIQQFSSGHGIIWNTIFELSILLWLVVLSPLGKQPTDNDLLYIITL